MTVEKIITKTEQKELEITGATLLSYEEYEKYKTKISRRAYWWWLRSPGTTSESHASYVNNYGNAYLSGNYVDDSCIEVVPALRIILNSDFEIGDKIKFGVNTFTIISEYYALCDNSIGYHCFREDDYKTSDANDYEKSDVKKFVDEWFERFERSEKE